MTDFVASAPARAVRLWWATAVAVAVALSPGIAQGAVEYYDIVTGERTASFDREGRDFGALRPFIAGFRDQSPQIPIASGSSFPFLDVVTGDAEDSRVNFRLEGGDFDGSTFSEIPADAYVGYRDGAASQIAILGPSGINYHDLVTGEENGIFDPLLTGGGPFDGRRFSELAPDDFAGFRDTGESQIALVPEAGPTSGTAAALATLSLGAWRRRRRPRPGR